MEIPRVVSSAISDSRYSILLTYINHFKKTSTASIIASREASREVDRLEQQCQWQHLSFAALFLPGRLKHRARLEHTGPSELGLFLLVYFEEVLREFFANGEAGLVRCYTR